MQGISTPICISPTFRFVQSVVVLRGCANPAPARDVRQRTYFYAKGFYRNSAEAKKNNLLQEVAGDHPDHLLHGQGRALPLRGTDDGGRAAPARLAAGELRRRTLQVTVASLELAHRELRVRLAALEPKLRV